MSENIKLDAERRRVAAIRVAENKAAQEKRRAEQLGGTPAGDAAWKRFRAADRRARSLRARAAIVRRRGQG